jgi:hypothetical protein
MPAPRSRRTTRQQSPLAAGTAFSDYQEARQRFLDTLRRDSELRRLEAAWRLPALGGRGPSRDDGRPDGASTGG